MATSDAPDPAIRSFHRPAADSSGMLLPSVRVGGATTIGPASIRRQIASFATIGLVSSIAYLLLYALADVQAAANEALGAASAAEVRSRFAALDGA